MTLSFDDITWHRAVGQLIDALDKPNFWAQLVRLLDQYVPFDSWVVLLFSADQHPQVEHGEHPPPPVRDPGQPQRRNLLVCREGIDRQPDHGRLAKPSLKPSSDTGMPMPSSGVLNTTKIAVWPLDNWSSRASLTRTSW